MAAARFIVRASSQFLLHPGGHGLDLLKHALDAINRFFRTAPLEAINFIEIRSSEMPDEA